jgi:restriction system protein
MAIGSRFAHYLNPVLDALRDLGGSARPREVYDWVAKHLNVSDAKRSEANKSGESRFENDVAWARFYLVRSAYVDSSRHGVWSLSETGRNAGTLSDERISEILREVQAQSSPAKSNQRPSEAEIERVVAKQSEQPAPEDVPRGYREQTITILQSLPGEGFERLCQRLLRESGFQQVTVTGRSGDGGIDGIGVLQVNPFVSFKVLFQCKRWSAPVGSSVIRDFRGAMMGRADKGLVLTTATFTADAQAEAVRDGVPPIELVDGEGLISLLEKLELGLVARTTYDVDRKFFDEFST